MYQYSKDREIWSIKAEEIITLYLSSNRLNISRYNGGVAEGSAFICGFRNQRDTFSMFIMIFYSQIKSYDIYLWENEDIELDTYSEAEEAAIAFCENIGFIMNNTYFRMASDEERRMLLLECPFAYRNIDEYINFISRRVSTSGEIRKLISEGRDAKRTEQTEPNTRRRVVSQEISSDAFTRRLARLLSAF